MYTSQDITDRRKGIHLLQHYLFGRDIYITSDINEYPEDPAEWTIMLMRVRDRTFHERPLPVFLQLIDTQTMRLTDIKPA